MHLALVDEVIEGSHGLFDGGLEVHVVGLVEVDVVRVEAAQAGIDGVHDVTPAQALVVGQLAHLAAALGGQDDVVAFARLLQPGADHFLGTPGPAAFGPGRVHVRRVDEVAPFVHEQIQHALGFGIVGVPTESGRAETDLRYLQARGSQSGVFHQCPSSGSVSDNTSRKFLRAAAPSASREPASSMSAPCTKR